MVSISTLARPLARRARLTQRWRHAHAFQADSSPILYLIRHGEKPPKEADGEDAPGLSTQGVDRAQGLVQVFGRNSPYNIGYIIAQEPKKHQKQDRPALTVTPLAESLKQYGVPFNTTIGRDDADGVAAAVQDYLNGRGDFQGEGNVLICWEHQRLQNIAKAIGVDNAPAYPGDRFDQIWTIKAPYNEINSFTSEHVPGLDDKYANEP